MKNALFFKTENGARTADLFMSLLYTAERAGESPFEYLVTLLRNHEDVAESPEEWLPYNYRKTLEERTKAAA